MGLDPMLPMISMPYAIQEKIWGFSLSSGEANIASGPNVTFLRWFIRSLTDSHIRTHGRGTQQEEQNRGQNV